MSLEESGGAAVQHRCIDSGAAVCIDGRVYSDAVRIVRSNCTCSCHKAKKRNPT